MFDPRLKDVSSKKLQEHVRESITKFFEGVLDFTEIAVGEEERYKILRSKILRLGNDTIRKINSEISQSYSVSDKTIREDIIRVDQAGKGIHNGK